MGIKYSMRIMLIIVAVSAFAVMVNSGSGNEPSVLTLLPPFIAIVAAFTLRNAIISLFISVWFGAWMVQGGAMADIFFGLIDVPRKYAINTIVDRDHAFILLMTAFIGGMMTLLSSSGALGGVVNYFVRWAKTRKRAQLSTAFMGLVIFFDDLTNSMVTGNMMRPLTDRLRVSREKLAYIVDSTSSPVTSIAVISLWVSYQIGLIEAATASLPIAASSFTLLLNSIMYSFYPILTIIFVFMVVLTGRDYGPMLAAERRALQSRSETLDVPMLIKEESTKPGSQIFNAILPMLVLMASVVIGILSTGEGESLREIVGSADSFLALLVGSFLGSLVAIAVTVLSKVETLDSALQSWLAGVSSIIPTMAILVLSWSLGQITVELQAAAYLTAVVDGAIPIAVFPAIVFILAALISLGTGSAWGTMAILMPLVVPLCWGLLNNTAEGLQPEGMHIFYSSISAVLAGAVWGDHCSPISDTTILSSMSSQCNHAEHVRTQIPYALTTGAAAVILGTLPAGFGMPWWSGLMLGASILLVFLVWFGEKTETLLVEQK